MDDPLRELARRVFALSEPLTFAAPWQDVAPPAWARRLPAAVRPMADAWPDALRDGAAALGLLSVSGGDDASDRLRPGDPLIGLPLGRLNRVGPSPADCPSQDPPRRGDLLLADGRLLTGGVPRLSPDRIFREQFQRDHALVVAHDLADVILLAALGLAVVPAAWVLDADVAPWQRWRNRTDGPAPEVVLLATRLLDGPGESVDLKPLIERLTELEERAALPAIAGLLAWPPPGAAPHAAIDDLAAAHAEDGPAGAARILLEAAVDAIDSASAPAAGAAARPGRGSVDGPAVSADGPAGACALPALLAGRDFHTRPVDGQPVQAILQVTSLETARFVPLELACPVGPSEGGGGGPLRTSVPAEVRAACWDRPGPLLASRAARLMGWPPEEAERARPEDGELVCGRGVLLGGNEEADAPVPVTFYARAHCAPVELRAHVVTARIGVHPDKRERILLVDRCSQRPPPHARYRPRDADLADVLAPFVVPEPRLADLVEQAFTLSAWAAAQLNLPAGPSDLLPILLALLGHASVASLVAPNGRQVPVGTLDVLLVGEPGVLKTTRFGGVAEKIGFAEQVAGEAMNRAGLLYAVVGNKVTPGVLPRNDGGLVVLDELHKDSDHALAEATTARSSGVLRVTKVVRRQLPMNVRMLAIGNLRRHGQTGPSGGASLRLADLEFGITGTTFLESEDLRRFDIVAVAAPPDGGDTPRPPAAVGQHCTWDGLRSLVALAWDLDTAEPSRFHWPADAGETVRRVTRWLRGAYDNAAVPLFGPSTVDKLLRVACAAARLMPPVADDQVRPTTAHIQFAAWLLHKVYTAPENGLRELARRERAGAADTDPGRLENLASKMRNLPDGELIAKKLATAASVTAADLAAACGCSERTVRNRLRHIRDWGLAKGQPNRGYSATTRLFELLPHLAAAGSEAADD